MSDPPFTVYPRFLFIATFLARDGFSRLDIVSALLTDQFYQSCLDQGISDAGEFPGRLNRWRIIWRIEFFGLIKKTTRHLSTLRLTFGYCPGSIGKLERHVQAVEPILPFQLANFSATLDDDIFQAH